MTRRQSLLPLLSLALLAIALAADAASSVMPDAERLRLRDKAKAMFFHAYDHYMSHAYPADELMPISCRGRYRGSEPSRGDIDDSLGNYSLTLIDSLDTLLLMNEADQFERAVRLTIDGVTFDTDVVVSVFEANIRVVGGLLGGHVGALVLRHRYGRMDWYDGQLLAMAVDLGARLLPAFNTSTGIPYPRVNLRHGVPDRGAHHQQQDTCTACAGSMLLEFAALSRFSGNPEFELRARRALDALWSQRNMHSNLMGTVINIHSGDWVRKESGIGAGIDSYYEYLFKAYVLLGEEVYLHRFSKHYEAVQNYLQLCRSPLLSDVLMHQPLTRTRNFMDALAAFWPGLQVMAGDLRPAVELHEILYQVVQRYNFIPEAFTPDFHVHWAHHPLRPEFIESTYFLYKATRDPHYLQVGRQVIDNLEKYSRTDCGYAAISDVRTMEKSDQLDSFVLAETFKYLYLLFADESDLPVDLHAYVFTTEAHLLPLHLANLAIKPPASGTATTANASSDSGEDCGPAQQPRQFKRPASSSSSSSSSSSASSSSTAMMKNGSCPNYNLRRRLFFADDNTAFHWRRQLHAGSSTSSSSSTSTTSPLTPMASSSSASASSLPLDPRDLDAGSSAHLALLSSMGIAAVKTLTGQLQLFHNADNAQSQELGRKGLAFMQAMIGLAQESGQQQQQQQQQQHPPNYLYCPVPSASKDVFNATILGSTESPVGPSQFGPALSQTDESHAGFLLWPSDPAQQDGCTAGRLGPLPALTPGRRLPWLLVLRRGGCLFVQKARNAEAAGAVGVIVADNQPGSSATVAQQLQLFAMSSDGGPNVSLPAVFAFDRDARNLLDLALFYAGPAPVVLAGRRLSSARLAGHWDSVDQMAGSFAGLSVSQSYSVHYRQQPPAAATAVGSGGGGFSCATAWDARGRMELRLNMDRRLSDAYRSGDFAIYWLRLEQRLLAASNLDQFYDLRPMLALLKDAAFLVETGAVSPVVSLAAEKVRPVAKLFAYLRCNPRPRSWQVAELGGYGYAAAMPGDFVVKRYTFVAVPADADVDGGEAD